MVELPEMSDRQKIVIFTAIGLAVGSAGTYLITQYDGNSQAVAGELVTALERQSGQDLEIVNVEEENDLYRVNIRNVEDQLNTYYVTKDGESFSQQMVDLKQLKSNLDARDSFSSCLERQNVTMYGNTSQQETVLQVQSLGGVQTVEGIFQDVNNPQVLQEAVSAEVQRVPAFYYNGEVLQGVNEVSQIEQFTGCQYSLE